MDQIILFGDSITQGSFEPGLDGFGQRLAHAYARKLDVINRGYSGYNTRWAIPVLKQIFPPPGSTVRLLVVWFGANDSCIPPSPQEVPLEEFSHNLDLIVSYARSASPGTKIILITPPPLSVAFRSADLASRDPPQKLDRLFANTAAYAQAVKDAGQRHGVPVVDVFGIIWRDAYEKEENLMRYLSDGLHLSARGYELAHHALVDTVEKQYPELAAGKMNMAFVPWAEIDFEKPESTLAARVG